MSQWRTLSLKDSAGSTKYLQWEDCFSFHSIFMKLTCLPFPSTKELFPPCFHPMYRPCPSSVCCMMINGTFVNKNKLVWLICSNPSCKYGSLLGTSFKGCVGELKVWFVRYTCTIGLVTCLFMLYPPFTKVLHIVDVAADTLCISSSSRHSSSKYTSSVLLSTL